MLSQARAHVTFSRWISLVVFACAIGAWPFLNDLELFEHFYEFSRAHEEWQLDEVAVLVLALTAAAIVSLVVQALALQSSLKSLEQEHDRADRHARFDQLTGLLNRRSFFSTLDNRRRGDEATDTVIVAAIDLDKFKPVNDLFGHAAGDATLRAVAQRLSTQVQDRAILARIGGDEFAMVFQPFVSRSECEGIVGRILTALEQPIAFEGTMLSIGGSIGLAQWTPGMAGADAIENADRALLQAKRGGRGRYTWYDSIMAQQSRDRAALEADFRKALRDGQIVPWFQPIVDLNSKNLCGFEVLARWTHPTRGPIAPDVFIPLAEEVGLIESLGWTVLGRACEIAQVWDPSLRLSFNMSPVHFKDRNLLPRLQTILASAEFDPQRLILELTEHSVIHDMAEARASMDAMRRVGISIELDDFGTGYSSLAGLQALPFDRIKIDQTFISGIGRDLENQRLVHGIMAFAKQMGLSVVAEGIETVEDLQIVTELGCAFGQGYLFERALPGDQVSWLLETAWADGVIRHQSSNSDPLRSIDQAS